MIEDFCKKVLDLDEKETEVLKPLSDYQMAFKNGALHILAYQDMCKFVGRNHEGQCESIIRDCMLIATKDANSRAAVLARALLRAKAELDFSMRTMHIAADRLPNLHLILSRELRKVADRLNAALHDIDELCKQVLDRDRKGNA